MLFGFKRKKKTELTEDQKKWNFLWEKYADGTLEEKYFVLCDYYSGINGGGHNCFFDNKEDDLPKYCELLKQVLPEILFDEFCKAYTAYIEDTNVEEACEAADSCFYKNEDGLTKILQTYANSLQ